MPLVNLIRNVIFRECTIIEEESSINQNFSLFCEQSYSLES